MFEVTRLTPPLPIKPFGTRTLYQGSIYLQSQKPLPPTPPPPMNVKFCRVLETSNRDVFKMLELFT